MSTSKVETFFDWAANVLGLAGGIPAIFERLNRVWGSIPGPLQDQIKQKMPGFLGLSLEDERIFNSLSAKLDIAKQKLLTDFLHGKCKDFQRNRFINIVAGMEVIKGTPTIVERKWNKDAKQFEDKTTAGKDGEDLRFNFLDKFADYIEMHGIEEAYKHCLGGRMVLENPFHQKVITTWRESVNWFYVVLLDTSSWINEQGGVIEINIDRLTRHLESTTKTKTATKASRPYRGFFRELFGF